MNSQENNVALVILVVLLGTGIVTLGVALVARWMSCGVDWLRSKFK